MYFVLIYQDNYLYRKVHNMKKALFLGILSSLFFAFTFILNKQMNLSGSLWSWSASLRYIFMLPILFFMVFAYMVNAKNKEITETNKAIEIAVKQIKMDTIQPKQSEFDSLANNHQRQTKANSDALQEDHLKMSAISSWASRREVVERFDMNSMRRL